MNKIDAETRRAIDDLAALDELVASARTALAKERAKYSATCADALKQYKPDVEGVGKDVLALVDEFLAVLESRADFDARRMVSPMSSSLFDTAGVRKYIVASERLAFARVATAAQAFRG